MATDRRRRDIATTVTGAGLVAGGGVARHAAVRQAERLTKRPRQPIPATILRHGGLGRQRMLYLAGATAGFAGATGMGVGVSNLVRKDDRSFLEEGFSGTANATKQRLNEARKPKSPKAMAVTGATAAATGGAASFAAHRSLDFAGRHKYPSLLAPHGKVRPATTAVVGAVGALAGVPVANRLMHRVSPGYEAVPGGGVRRKKTAAKRPSRGITPVELRASRGATFGARGQIVPSDVGKASLKRATILGGTRPDYLVSRGKHSQLWTVTNGRKDGPKAFSADSYAELNRRRQTWGTSWDDRGPLSARVKQTFSPYKEREWNTRSVKSGPKQTRAGTFIESEYRGFHRAPGVQIAAGTAALAGGGYLAQRQIRKDDRAQRVALEGAYATPVVGPVAGPLAAAHMAPKGQKAEAAGLTAGGRGLGTAAGAAAGAYGLSALARHNPDTIGAAAETAHTKINNARSSVASKLPSQVGRHIEPKTGAMTERLGRMAGHSNPVVRQAGRALIHASGPLKAAPAAAALGGYAGAKLGALGGGQGAYSIALRNQHKKAEQLSKGMRFAKAGMAQPLTSREKAQQYKRKRRGFALSTIGTGVGIAGTTAYAASLAAKHPRFAPHFARIGVNSAKLEHAGIHTALAGGGISAASGVNNFGVQRRNLRDEKAKLQRHNALPTDTTASKALRRSALRMVPTAVPGVRKPVRVANSVTKSFVNGKYVPITRMGATGRSNLRREIGNRRVHRSLVPVHQRGNSPQHNKANRQLAMFNQHPTVESGRKNVRFSTNTMLTPEHHAAILRALPKKVRRPIVVHGGSEFGIGGYQLPKNAGAVTSVRAGSRQPSHIVVDRHGIDDRVTRHEYAHSQARRNFGRMQQVTADPYKLAGEEARADAHAARHFPNGKWSGYEQGGSLHQDSKRNRITRRLYNRAQRGGYKPPVLPGRYNEVRARAGSPVQHYHSAPHVNGMERMVLRAGQVHADHPVATTSAAAGTVAVGGLASYKANQRYNEKHGLSKLDTTMDRHTAEGYKQKYGLRGPLPKNLPRDEKMRAYEGRYVAAGGPKGEVHQRRADRADKLTGASLGVGGASALGELAGRHPRVATRLPHLGHKAGMVGLGSVGVGALSELYHRHQEHKARSYRSSPAGVAASALRRMRDYTP